jgi:hypothetical protein
MNRISLFAIAILGLVIASCAPKEHLVDCNSTTGSYICFNGEGRDATYARWNFDTVQTFNAFDIQGSYPAIPGTTGPWTTVNLTLVNSTGSMAMETGLYDYYDFLTNSGQRKFTFWMKRYEDDAQDPTVKNFVINPYGVASLQITNIDGSGKLSGQFDANVWNIADTTETAFVKYRFENIDLQ